MPGITVTGIPDVQRNLSNFPRLLVMQCLGKALSKAAGVFEEELRATCPETDYSTSSDDYGHLVDNLLSEVTIDTEGRGGKASVGFGRKGMVALWVEYGHRMLSHSGAPTKLARVQANPFMRRAAEAAADRAIEVFTETIKEYMKTGNISEAA